MFWHVLWKAFWLTAAVRCSCQLGHAWSAGCPFRRKSHACEEPGDSGLDSTAEAPHCQWISDALFIIQKKSLPPGRTESHLLLCVANLELVCRKPQEFEGQGMLINSCASVQGRPQHFKNYLSLCLISITVDRIWSDIQSSAHLLYFFFILSRYAYTHALGNFFLKQSCALFWD